ncbi:MAG: hypothetical protein ACPG5T_04435 [Endozoicomonas sp.]
MIFCEGLVHPEAAVLMADGQWLVAKVMMGVGCVSRINGGGSKVITVKETGRPNGLLVSEGGSGKLGTFVDCNYSAPSKGVLL